MQIRYISSNKICTYFAVIVEADFKKLTPSTTNFSLFTIGGVESMIIASDTAKDDKPTKSVAAWKT